MTDNESQSESQRPLEGRRQEWAQAANPPSPPKDPTSGHQSNYYARASLISAIVGIFVAGAGEHTVEQYRVRMLLFSIIAVILGIVGLKQSKNLRRGRRLAISGIVIGGVFLGTCILGPALDAARESQMRQMLDRKIGALGGTGVVISPRNNVYYSGAATAKDASDLGAALTELGIFSESGRFDLVIAKGEYSSHPLGFGAFIPPSPTCQKALIAKDSAGLTTVSLVIQNDFSLLNDPSLVHDMKTTMPEIANQLASHLHRPISVRAVDCFLRELISVPGTD